LELVEYVLFMRLEVLLEVATVVVVLEILNWAVLLGFVFVWLEGRLR
jgi:hypothetical protein